MRQLLFGTSLGLIASRLQEGVFTTVLLFPEKAVLTVPSEPGPEAIVSGENEVSDVLCNPKHPNTLVLATRRKGLFRSEDGGHHWESANEGVKHKKFWCLTHHPKTGELYAGAEPSALYVSPDSGKHWNELEALQRLPSRVHWAFPSPHHEHHVKNIVVDPSNPDRLFAALEEGWIVRTLDHGKSWQNLSEGMEFDAHSVEIFENSPVVLATSGNGFFRSEDGGDHFQRFSKGLTRSYLSPIAVHSSNPDFLFLCASRYPPPRWFGPNGMADTSFYFSEDGGRSWKEVEGVTKLRGGAWAASHDPKDPNFFCAALSDGSVWVSEDRCRTFRCILFNLGTIARARIFRELDVA